jgi:uncharacterized protein YkwD
MPYRRSFCTALLVAAALANPVQGSGRGVAYLAPTGYCTGDSVVVMLCLHDYARRQAGLPALRPSVRLAAAARAKSVDIARCGFSHTACGHRFPYRVDRAGYRWSTVGENLAWGTGPLRRPYAIFSAWLKSPEHQANILSGAFRDVGIAVRLGPAAGHANAAIWVAEFGHQG